MLVTEKFVFVHLPRSGGTFVSQVVQKFFPSREIGYHLPLRVLPAEFSHLPVLGTVRNPWEFYVSWYHHQLSNDRRGPLISFLTENRRLDFVETIRNALNLCLDEKLDVLADRLPEDFNYKDRHVSNLTRDVMRRIRGTGMGLYSFRFNEMFGPGDDVCFCRVDSLRNEIIAFFDKLGVATDELCSYVLELDKKNTSEHRHYSSYYTPELAQLVAVRDRQVIDRFQFRFEDRASRKDALYP
jgi:hypothetical protein